MICAIDFPEQFQNGVQGLFSVRMVVLDSHHSEEQAKSKLSQS